MRRLLAGLVLLACSLALAAENKSESKPNSLTPREIADGWILLFDGESTFGWRSPNDSKWTVADGMLAPQADKPGLLSTTTSFQEYELSVDFRCRMPDKARVSIRGEEGVNPSSTSGINLLPLGSGWVHLWIHARNGEIVNRRMEAGTGLARFAQATAPRKELKSEPRPWPITLSGSEVVFKNIKLKPLATKPLFNGKDLTGWKEHPNKKSKFSVTSDGLLTIKDGPGDLQTEESWSDFLLQLECRTNGPRLNSGVFFRCRPGEYQNGYEAQIHNGFLEEPKDVTVEEYDSKTHELKEKHKVKTRAMDYGTGAIYRRIPARKQAAKDQEWFTMTVVAEGRHIATWVNGVQMVDWTDNRPLKDNARNGCRLEAGPISLQGHDPTTDLSFRNIRLADLNSRKEQGK